MFTEFDRDIMHLILAGIIWLVVAACAGSSLYSQTHLAISVRRRWLVLILALPLLGLLLYIPFSLDNPKIFREWINKLLPGKNS